MNNNVAKVIKEKDELLQRTERLSNKAKRFKKII